LFLSVHTDSQPNADYAKKMLGEIIMELKFIETVFTNAIMKELHL